MIKKLGSLLSFLASSATGSTAPKDQEINFSKAEGWTIESKRPFLIVSESGEAMIEELQLDQKFQNEALDFVNYIVTTAHHKQFGGEPSAATEVNGENWNGYLQSQPGGIGGYEFQLVARSGGKTYVFYLALPELPNEPDMQKYRDLILSLKVS
ncbi:hypothetical protein VA7868_03497 [Vibrio aerogenes CECT 7868]|uniref:Uncharacterized protein n=1 Tax=Vibrio aerogenes CECT 7868 TaxID=1216006 RepID=A0A1M6A6Z9_9VIBR|nr:hypothetical protein [Vibrio aerogenes]SHI32271.1 hypothetical protein VA7868_03497 [Vibrio aerogenes CECT 7868]